MLEIIALIYLCNQNKKSAMQRGRKPGLFVALTVCLWVGGEVSGFVIGQMMGFAVLPLYITAIALAAVGAVISVFIARNCKPGNYKPLWEAPLPGAVPLGIPHSFNLKRESSIVGIAVKYTFILNGEPIGELKNAQAMSATTSFTQNVLVAQDVYGNESVPIFFSISSGSGATIDIRFKSGAFLPKLCKGCHIMTKQEVSALAEVSVVSQVSNG